MIDGDSVMDKSAGCGYGTTTVSNENPEKVSIPHKESEKLPPLDPNHKPTAQEVRACLRVMDDFKKRKNGHKTNVRWESGSYESVFKYKTQ